ncbi:MAG: DUF3576 domain-containing protein [Alphaproteobacteria bacterium]|nr:DUF3576 domain-containing protein [Alphaproteobacteria bacterium]
MTDTARRPLHRFARLTGMRRSPLPRFAAALGVLLLLSGCGEGIKREASYPTRPKGSDKIVYSDQKADTIWGEGRTLTDRLFGTGTEEGAGSAGIGVNSFLWRASLDSVAFMPLASADPFGGVILTDWYENPDVPGERFKLNVFILDRQLRSDGVRVAVFKQNKQSNGNWRDAAVAPDMALGIENAILSRARELRVAQMGRMN